MLKSNKIYCLAMFLIFSLAFAPSISYGQDGRIIIRDVAYSPDGAYLAYTIETPECYSDSPSPVLAQIVDATSREIIQTFGIDEDCPYDTVSWSPDSSRIAMSSLAGTASIWDVTTGNQVSLYSNSGYGVRSLSNVAWNPINERLLVADGGVVIWDAETGNTIGFPLMIAGFPSLAYSSVWSPDGTRVAVATRSNQIEIWDISATDTIPEQWPLLHQFDSGEVTKIDYSPDAQLIAGISDSKILIFEVSTGLLTKTFELTTSRFTDIGWSPDGLFIVASDSDGLIHLWDYADEIEISIFETSTPIWTLDWSPSGEQIAFGGLVDGEDFIGIAEISELAPIP